MPAPFTIITLADEDGDEFPVRLPGVYKSNLGADIEAAIQILGEDSNTFPRGKLTYCAVEYSDPLHLC